MLRNRRLQQDEVSALLASIEPDDCMSLSNE
jgi:hypothetical protein